MNKQPQTCYVVNNGRTDLTLKGIRKFEYVNELTDRYIFTKEELEAQKNEWQRESADWFYPEKGEYPEMVENQNYSLNVLAEVEGMNDIQVMCYCYIPGEDGGFVWANCDKKLDGDAEFDDNYIVKKWKYIPVI